ncbi:hypothetical protein [Nocardia sp. NBC_00416]|uniref:hypothetical protein n=1 Tax=Nocardia sp. NBC_00416 TaxID=2975991 RepID=UPI002E1D8B71
MGGDFGRQLVVSVDARGFGSSNDQRQRAIQAGIFGVLDRAADRAELDRSAWDRQHKGDGELAVLPATVAAAEPVLIDGFVRELNAALAQHNHGLRGAQRLRLRLAIHFGVVAKDENGLSGQATVAVSRLVDCAQAKRALDFYDDADLVVVLSNTVFADSVVQRYTDLDPRLFRRVRVRSKEFDDDAFLFVPGHDVNEMPLTDTSHVDSDPTAPEPSRQASRGGDRPHMQTGNNTFHGSVTVENGTIGNSWVQR